jgi:DHA1 family multidrug resistance protein-like MFS transporter
MLHLLGTKARASWPDDRGPFLVAASQFGMTFSFNFMMAFMPFYIIRISPFDHQKTMIWIGLIMGATHILTAVAAPVWGGLTSRFRPKILYEAGFLCNGVLILLMGFTNSLVILLLLRVLQGALGGVSTIGMILISASSSRERLRNDLSFFQNCLTAGQLVGPPLGTYVASSYGYRAAFILTSILIILFLLFCHLYVADIPPQKKQTNPDCRNKSIILSGWVLSLVATVHLTFLPSILPDILENFGWVEKAALNLAGIVIMSYTATAILGTYLLSRLSSKTALRKIITIACLAAALGQVLLFFSEGVVSFIVIRMIQTGFIAGVFPLIIAFFAQDVGGGMIGFLNSARFFGVAFGPLVATSLLAYAGLLPLYAFIAVCTLISLGMFLTLSRNIET